MQALCFFLAVLALAAWPVGAQETATLLLRPRGLSAEITGALALSLAERLNQTPGLLALVPQESAGRDAIAEAEKRSAEYLQEAWDSYRKLDPEGALKHLADSRAALLQGCGGADAERLRSWQLLEGLAHFSSGNREQVQRSFEQLAAIDPGWQPDPKELAPKIVAEFQEAKRTVSRRAPSLIEVAGRPSGASVYLDGRKVGGLPVVLEGVLPGNHCLEVTAASHGSWFMSVTVPEASRLHLRAVLLSDQARLLLSAEPGLPAGQDPGEIARGLGTDLLVLGDVAGSEVVLWVLSASSGKASRAVRCPEGTEVLLCLQRGILDARSEFSAASLAPKAGNAIPPELPPLAGLGATNKAEKPQPEPPAWYQRWWVWTIVGCVLAGTGVGLALLLPSGGGYRGVVSR